MKKFTAILAAMIIALFVVSCGGDSKKDNTDTTPDGDQTDTDTTDAVDDTDKPDTGDTEPTCLIDDSYKKSSFKEYFTFKGAGEVYDANDANMDTAPLSSTTLYIEAYPNLGKPNTTLLIYAALNGDNGNAVVVDTYNLVATSNTEGNGVEVQAIIPEQWMQATDQLMEEYPDDFDRAPFGPMVYVNYLEFTIKGQSIDMLKSCTAGFSHLVYNEIAQGDMPEGSFQYCYGKDGTAEPGQTIKLGIDAGLVSGFENLQAIFNQGLEEGDEGYVAKPADLCTCSQGNSYIDCPVDPCEDVKCGEGKHCVEADNEDGYECVEDKEEDDTDVTPDSDTAPVTDGDTETPDTDTDTAPVTDGDTETPDTDTDTAPVTDGDTETPDTETPDTETPDTETPDTETPDTETPDTETPDTETPDTETPDTETPDTETPDTDEVIPEP